jgi:hypothetical protein
MENVATKSTKGLKIERVARRIVFVFFVAEIMNNLWLLLDGRGAESYPSPL